MALDLVRKNNIELIKGVDRAQTTTIAGTAYAVIVSQALSRQKLVLDQISALNATTSELIEQTSQPAARSGHGHQQQAASSTIDVQKLQAAFENVFQTMDALDTFRAQAVDSMAQTVTALEGQIERAKPYLERTRPVSPVLRSLTHRPAPRRSCRPDDRVDSYQGIEILTHDVVPARAGTPPPPQPVERDDSPAALLAPCAELLTFVNQNAGRPPGRGRRRRSPGHRHGPGNPQPMPRAMPNIAGERPTSTSSCRYAASSTTTSRRR